ncbi:50S ribosomal protein L16 [Candidatus Woesebacteria bacterium]|nr:50S ribosomal protein L16 [Candidatus Woesebacteria bacterium]QQG47788.1 MAG: 50S ribosomal protein L16 [Candidatus Woesebacteria bacterium]
MLQPKRQKHRKMFRGRMRGTETRGTEISFGELGLKAQERGNLSANQIEAARRTITNELKRKGRVWIRVFPDKPITKRGPGQRMGGGKGDIDHYAAVIKPGRVILEIAGAQEDTGIIALKKAARKLPFKTKIISKE